MHIFCKFDALVPLDELIPNKLNANDHSEEQIDSLCLLFETYGIRHPIICDEETKIMVVGHGRLLAAKQSKMEGFPVVYQKFATPAQRDQFAIADNGIALQGELNFTLINKLIIDWGSELKLDTLAVKDLTLDRSERPEKKKKKCPGCGFEF